MASAQDGEGQSQYDKIIHIRQGTPVPVDGLPLWIFNRDRGTLPDMYDFIILQLPFTISSRSRTTEGNEAI